MDKIVYSIVWILLLLFITWPIAGFLAGFWLFLQPFEACFSFVKEITSFLEKILTWPRDVGEAIRSGTSHFPKPNM